MRQNGYNLRRNIFAEMLKNLKKSLPISCSFISPIRLASGETRVRVIVKGEEYHYSIPQDFDLTSADISELYTQILNKCNTDVE